MITSHSGIYDHTTLTATAAAAAHSESAWHFLTASQRDTSFSPLASSAYRHPMAAVRPIDDLFANTAAAVLALATLDEVQRHNRDDKSDEDSPRTKCRFARGKGATKTCMYVCTAAEECRRADLLESVSRTQINLQLPFACPSPSRVKRPQEKHKKLQIRSD